MLPYAARKAALLIWEAIRMKMFDCDVCMSAGSVNQWGYCEICGEEFEDPGSRIMGHEVAMEATSITAAARLSDMVPSVTPAKLAAIAK